MLGTPGPNGTTRYHRQGLSRLNRVRIITIAVNGYMEAFRAEQRRNRKTKVQPSQVHRRKPKPKKCLGERYRVSSYALAIARGCKRAGIPHWHPHQLRHTKATEIRREAGLDAARAVLGHRSPKITEVYAELDTSKAAEIMERLG